MLSELKVDNMKGFYQMTLVLNAGTTPEGLEVKTYGIGPLANIVHLGEYEISMADFLITAEYVLTNTDLLPDDLRRKFVQTVRSLEEIEGHNPGGKRLISVASPAASTDPP